jgi:peptidoglycan/xylan/chitin deacetylase (PgdA/CDA1 family)
VAVATGRSGCLVAVDRVVLCYHACSADWSSPLAIRPNELREHVEVLRRGGYRFTTFADSAKRFADSLKREGDRERVAAITFDDGYRSVLRDAKPVLDDLGVVATVFVPAGLVGPQASAVWSSGLRKWIGTGDEAELRLMDWPELGELTAAGWEVGSHGMRHRRLTELPVAELDEEMQASKEVCERQLGLTCVSVAYPFGATNSDVEGAAARAGYEAGAAVSVLRGGSRFAWPRIDIYRGTSGRRLRLMVSQSGRRMRQSKSWGQYVSWRVRRDV